MNEEDIKRIEKKVDLLYKIILTLDVDQSGDITTVKTVNSVIDELLPLFNLSAEKEIIKIRSYEEIKKEKEGLKSELKKLEKEYQNGNYLAKEESQLKRKMEDLTNKIEELNRITAYLVDIMELNKELYEVLLYKGLRKKLGIQGEISKGLRIERGLGKIINLANVIQKASREGINLYFIDKMDGDILHP